MGGEGDVAVEGAEPSVELGGADPNVHHEITGGGWGVVGWGAIGFGAVDVPDDFVGEPGEGVGMVAGGGVEIELMGVFVGAVFAVDGEIYGAGVFARKFDVDLVLAV